MLSPYLLTITFSALVYLHYFLQFYLNCKRGHGKSCLRNHQKVEVLTQVRLPFASLFVFGFPVRCGY